MLDCQRHCYLRLLIGVNTMEVNGIATFSTASNFGRSREFYRELLPFLGWKPVIDTETTYYCVGGRTAVGISRAVRRA